MGLALDTSNPLWQGFIDVVDVTDPSLIDIEVNEESSIGVVPVTIPFMANGVDYMMSKLKQRYVSGDGPFDLVRIHGHGRPGTQCVSWGRPSWDDIYSGNRAVISADNCDDIADALEELSSYMSSTGEVWLMGCQVGSCEAGDNLVSMLADLWGVTVRAAILTQYVGGDQPSFALQGPTNSASPN